MHLTPALLKAYSQEHLTAREAQAKAEWIAWGPIVFQVTRLMKKFGILEMLRNSDNGMTEAEVAEKADISGYESDDLFGIAFAPDIDGVGALNYVFNIPLIIK